MRIPLVVAVLCLAAPVGAQTPPPPPPPDQSPSETEGKPVQELPQEETTPPAATKKTAPAKSETGAAPELPGTTHTVVPGDTLWDLSQHYLGSPWYWPKVWSYNPQIANPHWIYPGNQVRFFTGTGEEPAGEVESIEPGTGTQGEGDIAVLEQVEDNTVSMVGPKPYEPQGHERLPREGFVTDKELDGAGVLAHSFAETDMLVTGDIVYLTFKDRKAVVVGKNYLIFRPDRKVYDPRTARLVGYLTSLVGQARVLENNNPYYARGVISFSFDAMFRGDRVGPAGEPMVLTISQVPNTNPADLEGVVVANLNPYITVNGERSQVVVNLGSASGVQQGNTFTIIRQADPYNQWVSPAENQDPHLPAEVVGQCIAAEVKEHASTCMLIRTAREIVFGDRIVLRAPGKAPVSSR